jgi:chaperonin cofactor prefoldin
MNQDYQDYKERLEQRISELEKERELLNKQIEELRAEISRLSQIAQY